MSRTETLPATTDSPATARKLIRSEMSQCDEQAIAAAELMISELVTNAVVHGGTPIRIDLHHEEGADVVRTAVTDEGEGRPVVLDPEEVDPHGRGLIIVRSLAAEWGVAEAEAGKCVWFTLPCHHYGKKSLFDR